MLLAPQVVAELERAPLDGQGTVRVYGQFWDQTFRAELRPFDTSGKWSKQKPISTLCPQIPAMSAVRNESVQGNGDISYILKCLCAEDITRGPSQLETATWDFEFNARVNELGRRIFADIHLDPRPHCFLCDL